LAAAHSSACPCQSNAAGSLQARIKATKAFWLFSKKQKKSLLFEKKQQKLSSAFVLRRWPTRFPTSTYDTLKADQQMTALSGTAAIAIAASLLASAALAAPIETSIMTPAGRIITPASSQPTTGFFAHTNIEILQPKGQARLRSPRPWGYFETPASLACLYRQVKQVPGCDPKTVRAVATGGSKVVVIVDAYDYPTARHDLGKFSRHYGLPTITKNNFQKVYADGTKPQQDPSGDWEVEEVLVEANSNSGDDLVAAETVAAGIAANAGGGEVSNSWGESEFAQEEQYESTFTGTNVVFFASSGDVPGTEWPSIMSNVVGVGGTEIIRDYNNGDFLQQQMWWATGGGLSEYVPTPPYQSAITNLVGTARGAPDVALDASPVSGVWIYDTTPLGGETLDWVVVGGTSVASPAVAAIVNSAGNFAASSVAELTTIYANLGNKQNFTNIWRGECGNRTHPQGGKGWNACTGVGAPRGAEGK
jgi:kumamolisin